MSSPLPYQTDPNNFANPVESTNSAWLFQQDTYESPQCLELACRNSSEIIPITEKQAKACLKSARMILEERGLQLKNVQDFSINRDLINIAAYKKVGGEYQLREYSIEAQSFRRSYVFLEDFFTTIPESTESLAFSKLSPEERREKQALSPLSFDKAETQDLYIKPATSQIDGEEITEMTTFARRFTFSISQIPQGSSLVKESPTRAISPIKHVERTASYKLTISLSNQETGAPLGLPIELWKDRSSTLTGILHELMESSAKKLVLNEESLVVTPDSFYLNGIKVGENKANTHWITEHLGTAPWKLTYSAKRSEPLAVTSFTATPPETAIVVPRETKG